MASKKNKTQNQASLAMPPVSARASKKTVVINAFSKTFEEGAVLLEDDTTLAWFEDYDRDDYDSDKKPFFDASCPVQMRKNGERFAILVNDILVHEETDFEVARFVFHMMIQLGFELADNGCVFGEDDVEER